MVPWHLPFHRANVAAAAQQAVARSKDNRPDVEPASENQQQQQQQQQQQVDSPARGGQQQQRNGGPTPTPAQVDTAKGSVVFQRYYHLFEAGELEQVVAEVPGAECVESFYDKSNWCVVIERRPPGSGPG
jgi:alkylated DNA repair protein alkB family protein 8